MVAVAIAGIPVSRLLEQIAAQQACVFHVDEEFFTSRQLFAGDDFSFVPFVVLQAVRIARQMGRDLFAQMSLVGAEASASAEAALGLHVEVRPLHGDDLATLRGLLFQQAADEVFGWQDQKDVDLRVVFDRFAQGYEPERAALETYTAQLAAALLDQQIRHTSESMA